MLKRILTRLVLWNLTTKIVFLFVLNAGAAIYIEQVSEGFLKEIRHEIHAITTEDIPLTKIVTAITIHQLEQAVHFERASKYAEIFVNDKSVEDTFTSERKYFDKLDKKVEEELVLANTLINEVLAIETNELILAAFSKAKAVLDDVAVEHKDFSKHANQAFDFFLQGDLKSAHGLSTIIQEEEDHLDKTLAQLALEIEAFTEESLLRVEQLEQDAEKQVREILVTVLSISGGISFIIILGVAIPVTRMKGVLIKLGGGFSTKIPSSIPGSEMGELFDAMASIGNNLDAMNKTQVVVQYRLDGTIITANDLFLNSMGYTQDEIVGMHHSSLSSTDEPESKEYKDMWERLCQGESIECEYRRISKDRSVVWFGIVYTPILNSRGQVTRITEFSSDITELVKSRHQNEMISLVASKTDNSVVITDAEERIEYINEGFTRLTGFTFDEAVGKKPGELLQGKDTNPETRAEIRRSLDEQKPFYNEILNYAKDGSPYWISLAINPVFDENGKLKRFVSIQGDVTQNKMTSLENERGMNESVGVLDDLAKGDLRQKMTGEYDGTFGTIQTAINETIDNLVSTTSEIKEMSGSVSTAAREISVGSADLAQRTEQQAARLEETAAAVEALTDKVRANTKNAREASTLSQSTSAIASQGGQVVSEAVDAMQGIQGSSKKIADIISTIDEISFQTNLLALNAAVEAARAGEAGKGFAVVAQEVRALAGRSSEASDEIRNLISSSVDEVQSGVELVNKSGETLSEIVTAVQDIAKLIESIAAASTEQSTDIEEVNAAVSDLDQATQQNAALVEQSTAAAQSMTDQARRLAELVGFFKTHDE